MPNTLISEATIAHAPSHNRNTNTLHVRLAISRAFWLGICFDRSARYSESSAKSYPRVTISSTRSILPSHSLATRKTITLYTSSVLPVISCDSMIVPQPYPSRVPETPDFYFGDIRSRQPYTTSLTRSEVDKQFMGPQYLGASSFANFDNLQQPLNFAQQQTPREWASYTGSDQNLYQPQQLRPTPQHNAFAHRRQPSDSSDSFGTSPHMNSAYDQQRQFLSPWEAQQSPSSLQRHLPTPSHTPTQDSFPSAARSQQVQAPRISSSHQHDLPVTPRTMNGDDFNDAQFQAPQRVVPKLDRTISDIYQDELYNPSFSQPAPQQMTQQQQQQAFSSAYLQPHQHQQQHPNMVNERLQAANQARSASPGNLDKLRAVSPFRHGSPFATGSSAYGQSSSHMQSAADTRRQQKAVADAVALQQHRSRANDSQPTTISPKDAVLDYKQDPDDVNIPLFPQSQTSQPLQHSQAPSYAPHTANHRQSQFSMPQTTFDFTQPSHLSHDARYGPVSFQPMNSSQGSQAESQTLDFPAHLVSMETSKSEDVDDDDDAEDDDDDDDDDDAVFDDSIQRPARTTADSGTYTCTYHGCQERFESPARLQKHKREDHRSTGHGGPPPPSASPSAPTMTQAGPHRCDRINPQTGKPCATIFSRPYDLTRHEDTIHNRQKTKVRCHLCTDEKTFSRSDALTRHMKVVHPTEPWPAKHKKRV